MPLKVLNNESSTTVFAKNINGESIRINWGAKGTPTDTQRVPDRLAEDVDFLNSLERGIFTIVGGNPEVIASIDVEVKDMAADKAAAAARIEESMDRKQDNDILQQTCIGPAPVGRSGECGKLVLIRNSQRHETPPLCSDHAIFADQFYLAEDGSKGEGATRDKAGTVTREWKRIVITQPQRSIV